MCKNMNFKELVSTHNHGKIRTLKDKKEEPTFFFAEELAVSAIFVHYNRLSHKYFVSSTVLGMFLY